MPELVALRGAPGPAWVEQLQRCWEAGDAVLPVDPRLPDPAVADLLDALRPTAVQQVGGERVARRDGRPAEAHDAVVLATSGTTGAPKGVVITHDAIAAAARLTSEALGVDPATDRWLCCLPLAHAGGFGVVTRALLTRTALTVRPAFEPGTGATLTSLVATQLRRVDATEFRAILLGGDAPPDALPPNAVVTYGLTETGGGCVYDGIALPTIDVRIDGTGQIHLRGPVLGRAYRTATGDKAITGDDGWLATGDAGFFDRDHRLHVDGRVSDVIVTGGEKVWPKPVEAVLEALPAVQRAAVVGRPDPEWGHVVTAIVVPADPRHPPTLDELRAAVKERLPAWAAPRALQLATALPTTALGKVQRSRLQ